jgi:tetratricopeptide (TPR) repeat protein
MLLNLARLSESQRELERALGIFDDLADTRGSARTLDVLSMTDGVTARLERAIGRGRAALARFQELGDRSTLPSMMTNIGFFLAFAGRRAEAEPLIRQGLQAALEQGGLADQAYAHGGMGWLLEHYGDLGGALRESEATLALARRIEHREWTAIGLSILGRVTRICGVAARARPLHEEMLAISRELGTALWISNALAEIGEDQIALGDEAGGERRLHEAIEVAGEATQYVIPPCLALAELELARGHPRGALDMAGRAEDIAGGFLGWKLQARRLRGEALQALDAKADGLALLRATHATGVATGFAPVVWTTALALTEALARHGQNVEAAAMRAELQVALEQVAAGLPADLRPSFATVPMVRRARAT